MITDKSEETSKLFAFNKKKPMKFTIMKEKLLQIQCNQYSKMITNHGGILINYEVKDDECIVLAHRKQPPTKLEMYNIRYIKDCIKQNKVLNFLDYRIAPNYSIPAKKSKREAVNDVVENDSSKGACAFAGKVLMDNPCKHRVNKTAESILQDIQEKYLL